MATSYTPNRWGFGTVSAQAEFNELANSLGTHPSNAPVARYQNDFTGCTQIEKPTSLTCLLGNAVALHLLQTLDRINHDIPVGPRSASLGRSAATLLVITSKVSVTVNRIR
jgi:hypothetical protein